MLSLAIAFSITACSDSDNTDATENTESTSAITTVSVEEPATTVTTSAVAEEKTDSDSKISFEVNEAVTFSFSSYNYEAPKIEFTVADANNFVLDSINIDDSAELEALPETKIKELAETKLSLLRKLADAFNAAGLNVTIDEKTGDVYFDSSVLFGGDSSELSDEGKAFLKKFITTYTSVVFSEEFDGFISKIIVEGHTAPVAGTTYEDGLPLSVERAEVVKGFCLSDDSGVSASESQQLSALLESQGLSCSKPIMNDDGSVNMDASRRVTFKFLVNIE